MIQLRVNKLFENKVVIEIQKDSETIFSFKENYARPAEMIVLKLKGNELTKNLNENCKKLDIKLHEFS